MTLFLGYAIIIKKGVKASAIHELSKQRFTFMPNNERFSRTELLLGEEAISRLAATRVAIFGVGGVGGYVAEALCRSGVGAIDLIDADTVSVSNINRQIIALTSTVGRAKVEVMRERMLDINPSLTVTAHEIFYSEDERGGIDLSSYDYVVDAIDTVKSKIFLITSAKACGVNIISSMGAGNKLDPTAFEVTDIYKTSVCPLARVMRTELRKRGITDLKVVYSREEPRHAGADGETGRHAPGSVAFVPSVVGLIIAGEVIKDLTRAQTNAN